MGATEQKAFRWIKKGHIFSPDGRYPWMKEYAQVPTVLPLADRLRVYISTRGNREKDGNFQAYSTYVDLDVDNPAKVIAVHDRPILELGDIGTFDQFGVMACSTIPVGKEIWLYYGGWNRCAGVPYHHAIGLAVSKDGGATFSRYSKGPIITRSPEEPYLHNGPSVMKIGNQFHMWYGTGLKWVKNENALEPIYVTAHATSNDGIRWKNNGIPILAPKVEDECQSIPAVVKLGDRYHMWFSYRCGLDFRNADRGYRIGYAWSDDLTHWNRNDELGGLELSPGNVWDSQMVCYPRVIEVKDKIYMFYNGNYFGQNGFGYAVLDTSE